MTLDRSSVSSRVGEALRRGFLADAAWVVARSGAQAMEFAVWLVLARRLGIGDLGVLAVAMVVLRVAGLAGDWGATHRGARDVAAHGTGSEIVMSLVRRRQRLSGLLAVIWVAVTLVIGPELAPMMAVILARGAGRDWISLGSAHRAASAVPPLVQGVLLVSGSFFVDTLTGAAVLFGAAHLVAWVVSLVLNRLDWTSYSGSAAVVDPWYMLAGLADQVLISGDTVVLAVLRTSGEAGIYAIVYRYPAAWLMIIGLAVSAAVPGAARRARSGPLEPHEIVRSLRVGGLAGLTLAVLSPFAVWSLGPMFGVDFVAGRTALMVLLAATVVTTVSAPLRVLHVTRGSDRTMAVVTSAIAAANLALNLLVVARWGMTAAALTTLAAQSATLVFFLAWSRGQCRLVDDGHRPQVRATTST